MLVELDLFSGRENPRWSLDGEAAQTLRELAGRLTTATAEPRIPGLGYRGFVVANDNGEMRVFKGRVIKSEAVLADPSLSIERFLLDRLPREFRELRARLLSELEGSP